MAKTHPLVSTGFTLAVITVVAGGLWLNGRDIARREALRLHGAHITYFHAAGFGPSHADDAQTDLFGDGTVVFQSPTLPGGVVTHVPEARATAYFKAFEASAFWRETFIEGGAIDGPSCYTLYTVDGLTRETGCHVLQPVNVGPVHLQLQALEALAGVPRLQAIDRANLPADVRPYAAATDPAVDIAFRPPPSPPAP